MLKKLASTGLAAGLALGVGATGNVSFASELDDTQIDLSTQSNTELQDGQVTSNLESQAETDDSGAGLNVDLDLDLDNILDSSESNEILPSDDLLGGIL